jgi:hypothetical protein
MWAGLRAPKRIQLHRCTADKKHLTLIWANYSVTSYRVIDLVSGRQTTRFKEPSVPSAVYQHQPSQSQRQTSVPLVCSSATITIQVPFPTKRYHCTLYRHSTGTTSKRLRSRGSQAPSHNRPKSSTNSPLTDLEHPDAPRSPLTKVQKQISQGSIGR